MASSSASLLGQRRQSVTWRQANISRSTSILSHEPKSGTHPLVAVSRGAYAGRTMAVFTSGGDSQGMNAAVRAVVRLGLFVGAKVYLIREGYQGMVDGGSNFVEAKWRDVSNIMQKGGTVIGSARCMEFTTREGKLKAVKNLVIRGISDIVCIGGDGSLTGASILKEQWANLLNHLVENGGINQEQKKTCASLNIVGMVGSIDNDFCGTDMTIGADSALHRIIEAVDAIQTTADSHQRSFVLEVMGRHCGYLALVAGIACEADYVFIPEDPPDKDWVKSFCQHMKRCRELGQRLSIVIVAEGATDKEGNPITANMVKDICTSQLFLDTRVTVLGHVQRGGAPSAFDRVLATRLGAEAVIALMEADSDTKPCVISLSGNQAIRAPLMDCVSATKSVQAAMEVRDFKRAAALRGRSFLNNLNSFNLLRKTIEGSSGEENTGRNLAVVHIGAPAGGMNAATRAFVKTAVWKGYGVKAVHNGFEGFIKNDIVELDPMGVHQWNAIGGSLLGCQRDLPDNDEVLKAISIRCVQHNLYGIFIVGGFEGFRALTLLQAARSRFGPLNIPMCLLPATISNNVPGTDFSIGADTALNEIVKAIDKLKQSATGTRRRVFVVETQGAFCGYLPTLAGIAGGADQAYIFEEKFSLADLQDDVNHVKAKIEDQVNRSICVVSENANSNYNTDFITRLYNEDGKGTFTAKPCVLGHIQQGGNPSPFDRNMATKLSASAVEWITDWLLALSDESPLTSPESCAVIGIVARHKTITPVTELAASADFQYRIPKEQWWLRLRPLMRILSKHYDTYTAEGQFGLVQDDKTELGLTVTELDLD